MSRAAAAFFSGSCPWVLLQCCLASAAALSVPSVTWIRPVWEAVILHPCVLVFALAVASTGAFCPAA